jgi:hypothetical protein
MTSLIFVIYKHQAHDLHMERSGQYNIVLIFT